MKNIFLMIIIILAISSFSSEMELIDETEAKGILEEIGLIDENDVKINSSSSRNRKDKRSELSFFFGNSNSENGFFLINNDWKERMSFFKFIEAVRYSEVVKIWEMTSEKTYIYVRIRGKWHVILYQKPRSHKSGILFEF